MISDPTDEPLVDPRPDAFSGQLHGELVQPVNWNIAQEVPLVIFYNSMQFGVMMLTPGDYEDFAIGFSLSEGIVGKRAEISDIRLESLGDGMAMNIIVPPAALEIAQTRKRTITGGSSCGICGAQTLEIALPHPKKTFGFVPKPEIALRALTKLPNEQVLRQQNFSTHAAALFDPQGNVVLLREDIGRHNSLDKLIGAMARKKFSAMDGFLVLSSRYSIELAQKAVSFGFSFVASVSAPTSLALDYSKRAGMGIATLSGTQIMVFD